MTKNLRFCLDLNVWCAALLADAKGRKDTACQSLVEIVRRGICSVGKVELVISWGMLNCLQLVLQNQPKLSVLKDDAVVFIEIITTYAQLSPQLTLGGTGVIPLDDDEDRHVLETAIAGKATVLITANFQDFLTKEVQTIVSERHYIYRSSAHSFHIVHPFYIMSWLNQGQIPDINQDFD
ncbi:MAG TPA: PIN domain-containing protein [Cyanothece sp. UBA12306]|nr:PIN domain-containing protein [Cyanothece sp. UBA12306]